MAIEFEVKKSQKNKSVLLELKSDSHGETIYENKTREKGMKPSSRVVIDESDDDYQFVENRTLPSRNKEEVSIEHNYFHRAAWWPIGLVTRHSAL